MRFEEWWMDEEFNPMIYGPMESAWNAGQDQLRQRITELEAVIKSHGIPVKTYSGGVAHYCTGIYDAKEEV